MSMRAMMLVAPLALAVAACGHDSAPPPSTATDPHLAVVRVELGPMDHEQAFDGVLEAVSQSTVSAQTAGRIVELPVDVNTAVQKGDILARLRDAEPRARLDAAQAALKEAQAGYGRVKAVFDKKLIPQAQMDRATAARDAAQAAVDGALEQEGQALIRAPFAGIITARHVEVGELAAPGRPVVTLLSLDRLRAVVDVPQQFVGALRGNPAARVIFPDGASVDASAVVFFPYADEHTHTFRARVEFPGAGPHGIYPGELVKVGFKLASASALTVVEAALAQRGEVTGLYVEDAQHRLEFRAVRTGRTVQGGRIEVVAGLAAGEQVVSDPVAAAEAVRRQEGGTP
ncbi:efflux RND transporter periplasmic adaptor subunit [Nevskia soli]|uniref:efflux RND transporter periplasmic adaptor subunit n=1 Tax=Nevskia soli TaxID=418856 RepID=UPI00055D224A|nr:efflux RND transporter periplasmic adaptor subunit [Nevskia soli]